MDGKLKDRNPSAKQRDTNLELFRIITMLLIIAHHYVVNSDLMTAGSPIYQNPTASRTIFLLVFGSFGKTGINCFVMITGYFMCKSNITLKKFVKLLCEYMFYKIVISAVFWITGLSEFSFFSFITTIVPVTYVRSNFTACFLVFFLCIPFLNILTSRISQKQHLRLLLLLSIVYIAFGSLSYNGEQLVSMNYSVWFIVLYFIASYIRLYPNKLFNKASMWGLLSFVSLLLSVAYVVINCFKPGLTSYISNLRLSVNAFLSAANGICWFMFFKNLKIKHSRIINAVASTTFGVLCIHAHSDAMRNLLWNEVFKAREVYSHQLMPLLAIGSVICVFCVCSAFDYIRIIALEKPFLRLFDRIYPTILCEFNSFEKRIFKE